MPSVSSIFDRIIQPRNGTFSGELARYVLTLGFSAEDQERFDWLSSRAAEGVLDAAQSEELDGFLEANALLMLLQSKARVSLAQHPSAA